MFPVVVDSSIVVSSVPDVELVDSVVMVVVDSVVIG